ncbi:MAG: transcriptional regulator, family [Conexibacter sp.]|nr:transcriptional regulator, family [Conexibacter sp.]
MSATDDAIDRSCLGDAIRELRARRHVTQERLSYDAGLGRHFVGALERGERSPRFTALLALARALEVPLSELVELFERRRREASERLRRS